MKKRLEIAVITLALLASAAVAHATPFTLQLTSDHCTGLCGPQTSFGSIALNDAVSGQVTVTITLNNGNKFANTGFDGVVGFNLQNLTVNNSNVVYSGVSTGFVGLTDASGTYGPYSKFNGFGTFEYAIAATFGNGGGNAVTGPLVFTVAAAGITAQSFLEKSTGGDVAAYFAVDILSGTTKNARGEFNTGLVDASVAPTTVPDGGSTAALLGSVLLGVGVLRRKFGKV